MRYSRGYEGSVDIYVEVDDENDEVFGSLYHLVDDVGELTLRFSFSVSPYSPAVITGPVERCHPAEGGEVEDVVLDGVVVGEKVVLVEGEVRDRIQELCFGEVEEKALDQVADWLADERDYCDFL